MIWFNKNLLIATKYLFRHVQQKICWQEMNFFSVQPIKISKIKLQEFLNWVHFLAAALKEFKFYSAMNFTRNLFRDRYKKFMLRSKVR